MAKTEKAPTNAQMLEAGILALTNRSGENLYDDVAALPRDVQRTTLDVIAKHDRRGR